MNLDNTIDFLDNMTEKIVKTVSLKILGPEKYNLVKKEKKAEQKIARKKANEKSRKMMAEFKEAQEREALKEKEENRKFARQMQASYQRLGVDISFDGLTSTEEITKKCLEAERILEEMEALDNNYDDLD